jgi:hypothetical protein
MKKINYTSLFVLASISLFVGCKPELKVPTPSKGSIDPTRYVAVGNSITSGFADGALYYEGQLVAYPNLIAQQFKLVGGGTFNQPLMPAGSIGVGSTGNAPFKLGYSTDCLGVTSLGPIPSATVGDVAALSVNIYTPQAPFNNMGVPGTKAINVDSVGYAARNPFFARMASNPSSASILSDAIAINPTFFSLFIGNNDVLLYATNGGASDTISSQSDFAAGINNAVNKLTAGGAKGVIGNIPDITALPYFTTIPWNGLTLTRQTQVDSLNAYWADFSVTPPKPLYNFVLGNNGFLVTDNDVPYTHKRLIKEGEFILLSVPLNSLKCQNLGSLTAIPDKYVLTAAEISKIEAAISGYNATIKAAADAKGLAFVDVNAFLNKTKTGFVYDGITLNAAFVTGGAFSLDGIHLTPLGNALLANEFIKAVNAQFGASIPQLDATKYRGVVFP